MKPQHNLDWMLRFMALMPLRMLRDWCAEEEVAAFAGNVEEQYKILFERFREVMIDSGLLDQGNPDPSLRTEWMKDLESLEATVGPYTHPPWFSGDTGDIH